MRMSDKFAYISEGLTKRKDPFVYTLKYCESVTKISDVKQVFKDIKIKTFKEATPAILQSSENAILAVGFDIDKQIDVAVIMNSVKNGIPVMLISAENCYVEFIEYSLTETEQSFKCICKLKGINFQPTTVTCQAPNHNRNLECSNQYIFCKKVEKDTEFQEQIRNILIWGEIKEQNQNTGKLPVFRYSQFLDFITWRDHMGKRIEEIRIKKRIDKAITDFLNNKILPFS